MPGRGRRWGIAVVRGRSMEPTLVDGDRLLVRYGAEPVAGRLAVVLLPGDVLAVKRLVRRHDSGHGPGWWVQRDNPLEGVDSRTVGALPDADVRAIARCRIWPVRRRIRR